MDQVKELEKRIIPYARFREREILEKYRISRGKLYRNVKDGTFPKPIKMGFSVRYREEDILEWESKLMAS